VMSTVTRWFVNFTSQSINDVRRINLATRQVDPVGGVDRFSGVFATITEVGGPPGGGPIDFPFVGEAMISVWNVVPHDEGFVEIVMRIQPDFFGLNVRLQLLVCND
jgi:hypothetical protein